jgi:hypothetical protein
MTITNGIIKEVSLCIEDHGFLTIYLTIEMSNGSQCFGGYSLGGDMTDTHNWAGIWIRQIFEVAGVDNWKDIKGKAIRVMYRKDGYNQPISAIGHIVKEKWFDPESDFGNFNTDVENDNDDEIPF